MASSCRRPAGFSVPELLIALVIIAIALLGLISALTYGMRANEGAQRRSQALNYARKLMGEIKRNAARPSPNSWVFDTPPAGLFDSSESDHSTALDAAPFDTGQFPADTGMTRNIMVTQPLGSSGHRANLAQVRVRVFWQKNGVEKSVELVSFTPLVETD